MEQMNKRGLKDSDALVLFGENAALPHGSGSDRKLEKDDMVLIDAGGAFGGYVADVTRVGHQIVVGWLTTSDVRLAFVTYLTMAYEPVGVGSGGSASSCCSPV